MNRGVRVTKQMLSESGYPVYQNCLTPMGFYEKKNVNANTPFVICGGAAGEVGFSKEDFWAADDCEYIVCGDEVLGKYLYHCLLNQKNQLKSQVRTASIPRLSPSVIRNLVIPIPPIEEQRRIVEILDKFEQLTADLSCGLPAEITDREAQYAYYRDKLLTFKRKAVA